MLPNQIDVTVPPRTLRRHPDLKLLAKRLAHTEITERNGLALTTIPRTLADVIVIGIPEEQARLAVEQALEGGDSHEFPDMKYSNPSALYQVLGERLRTQSIKTGIPVERGCPGAHEQ